jgi:phosphoribosylglycinamide formyltransferase-1
VNLAVLISGRGTNLGAILNAVTERRLDARVAVVLSNRDGAAGLMVAATQGVPTLVLRHQDFPSRAEYESALVEALRARDVDAIALAGFDRLVTGVLLGAFPGRVLNIHPALLPSFPGLHAQRQALDYGVRITGVTVHFVDEQVDHGPIVAQATVPILDDDTEETLSRRILEQEHRLYPAALQLLASGQLRLEGRRVIGGLS